MKKWIVLLSGLLIVQLVLAAIVTISDTDYGAYQADEKLLVIDKQTVDHLEIDDASNSVVLSKIAEKWLLPDLQNFPADQHKVQQLLDNIANMKKGWPVATTSSAARRFRVAEDEYERRISLSADNHVLGQLYIGTSPGFRKVHVRNSQQDEVFAVTFNAWEAGASADDWIDKNILAFSADELLRVEMPDFVLQRENDEFRLVDLAEEDEINEPEVQLLVNRVSRLQIDSLVDAEQDEHLMDEADFVFKITLKPDEVLIYRFYKMAEEPFYILTRSDFEDYLFKIAEFHVSAIKETTRDKLLQTKADDVSDEMLEKDSAVKDID